MKEIALLMETIYYLAVKFYALEDPGTLWFVFCISDADVSSYFFQHVGQCCSQWWGVQLMTGKICSLLCHRRLVLSKAVLWALQPQS